jgi:hypothetical protein
MIFISYRRSDTEMAAGRLREALMQHFGAKQIFRDRDNIQPGQHWRDVIRDMLTGNTVVLALIGSRWATETDAAGQRVVESKNNANRDELELALSRRLRIIPVLVGGTSMPISGDLPEPLRALTNISALPLRDSDWNGDVGEVIAALERAGVTAPRRVTPPGGQLLTTVVSLVTVLVASLLLSTLVLVATALLFGWTLTPPETLLLVLIVFGITIFAFRLRAA